MGSIDRSRWPRKALRLTSFAMVFATTTLGRSQGIDDTTKACVDAYGNAQEHRKSQDLLKARDELRSCSVSTCPSVVQNDCTMWLAQVLEAIPSVILEAKVGDDDVFDVSVSMDGTRLVALLDGKPLEINPGLHTFVFEQPGTPPIEKKVIVTPRDKSQVVTASWPRTTAPTRAVVDPIAASGDVAASRSRPVPAIVYVLGATAVAGLGSFAVLGLTGQATQHDLEQSCSPRCSNSEVTSLRTRFLAADIAAGVGGASAVAALVAFLVRPEREAPRTPSTLGVRPTHSGGLITWSASF
jgi:hypothetical protein